MRAHLIVVAVLALAGVSGCDAPPPVETKPVAPVETPVVVVPDEPAGPAAPPTTEPGGQVVMATPPPPAKELKVLQFAKDSDALDATTTQQLSGFARYLTKSRKSVRLSGHTRPMTDTAAAEALASKRVDAVRRYLVLHDVNQAQIELATYAPDLPPPAGSGEDVLAQGDRVELELE